MSDLRKQQWLAVKPDVDLKIEMAEDAGEWLVHSYTGAVYTPAELRKEHEAGREWCHPTTWRLRNPDALIEQAKEELMAKQKQYQMLVDKKKAQQR